MPVLVVALTACNAAGRAPDDASVADFCAVQSDLSTNASTNAGSVDMASSADELRAWSADMQRVGTPSGTPVAARQGFEYLVNQLKFVDEQDFKPTLGTPRMESATDDELAAAESFAAYVSEIC